MLDKLLVLALAVAFAGCSEAVPYEEQVVTITAPEVPTDGHKIKLANCQSSAVLDYTVGESEAGWVLVEVREGAGVPIENKQFETSSEGTIELTGSPGKWNLKVDRHKLFNGSFKFTLTC